MNLGTKILAFLAVLLSIALVPFATVANRNQAFAQEQLLDVQSRLKQREDELVATSEALNASIAALQAKLAAAEAQVRVSVAEREGEAQLRAEGVRDAERLRLQVAELMAQVSAFGANDALQTRLIEAMRQDIEAARAQFLAADKVRVELEDALVRMRAGVETEAAARVQAEERIRQAEERIRQVEEQVQRANAEKAQAVAKVQHMFEALEYLHQLGSP